MAYRLIAHAVDTWSGSKTQFEHIDLTDETAEVAAKELKFWQGRVGEIVSAGQLRIVRIEEVFTQESR